MLSQGSVRWCGVYAGLFSTPPSGREIEKQKLSMCKMDLRRQQGSFMLLPFKLAGMDAKLSELSILPWRHCFVGGCG